MEVEIKAGWVSAVQQLSKVVGENSEDVTSNDIVDATEVGKDVLTAATQEAARDAIGAGTSNLTIGTTASTAKVGNYTPTVDEIVDATDVGKSVLTATTAAAARTAIGAGTSNLTIGTTASTAKAGNYTPTTNEVSASLKAKAEIAALSEIDDPTTATPEEVATAVNAIIAALKA